MKVLQFYRTYFPETQGGLEEAIRQICYSTSRLGVEQRILTMAHVPEVESLELPEATVIRVPLQAEPAACSMGIAMFKVYREQAKWADLIQVHLGNVAIDALLLAAPNDGGITGITVIAWVRSIC